MDWFRVEKKLRVLRIYPALLVLSLIVGSLLLTRAYVSHTGNLIMESYRQQSSRELSAGDVMSAGSRLQFSLSGRDWKCLRVWKDAALFMDESKSSSCAPGLFGTWKVWDQSEKGGIKVEVLFTAPVYAIYTALTAIVFGSLLLIGYTLAVSRLERSYTSVEFEMEMSKLREKAAVANLVSAISHDVRKPFSMFKLLMNAIQQMRDPTELRDFAAVSLPEVQRAIDDVEGLLQDVMQVNASVHLIKENISPERIITDVLEQTFRGQPEADVAIEYGVEPDRAICVDVHKCKRIFANIVGNACQAISWKGRIWIRAQQRDKRVSFVLGNSGSFIPPESMAHLYDAFFTSDKRGGTGLGLAIAKKWTDAHGGTISCRSIKDSRHPDGMVEFTFDLPSGDPNTDHPRPILMEHSSSYRMAFAVGDTGEEDRSLTKLSEKLLARLRSLPRPLQVIALDDEQTYLAGLKKTLEELVLGEHVQLTLGRTLDDLPRQDAHLLLVDFDLGDPNQNGLDLIRQFKSQSTGGLACLHTNRTDAATFRSAVAAGADAVYTKPITPEHLAKLIFEATALIPVAVVTSSQEELSSATPAAKNVAFVDDSMVMRLSWKKGIGQLCHLVLFKTPEEFRNSTAAFDIVITDLNFDHNAETGLDVLRWAREKQPGSKVFLFSNDSFVDAKNFDGRIDKDSAPCIPS